MSYTPTTWNTGDTVTASAMNKIENGIAGASPWDAVIRLTHSNDSGQDTASKLTPSIISGSYADMYSKIQNSEFPYILVQYYHPWGMYGWLEGNIISASATDIGISAAGFFPFGLDGSHFYELSGLVWAANDTIFWD